MGDSLSQELDKALYAPIFHKWQQRSFQEVPTREAIFSDLAQSCQHLGGQATVVIGCFDYRDFSIPFITDNVATVTGHPVSYFREKGLEGTLSLFHPEDREEVFKFQKIVLEVFDKLSDAAKKTFEFSYTYRWIDPDGEQYSWYSTKVKPYYVDAEGNIVYDLNFVMKLHVAPFPPVFSWEYSYVNAACEKVSVSSMAEKDIQLSKRELEILGLLASGLTSGEIADKLYLSINTVQTHRKKIMRKLSAHSMADLIKFAVLKGIL
ncbi:LuxR C-terminal-related transcriptional regulator [Penaeicola halotolerans]|uniref:LuxR C-terminal-related transcriptional regulator n=1 Tax=Penaeicola halotolerans TaxID=2793196 RepID=UPI001CF8BC12|nr:LuxR C-terminal-related transcriptional regulator [Penaeicola halotolerans]